MCKCALCFMLGASLSLATPLANAPQPLITPTYEGFGQVVHPDIEDFSNSWQGWYYWLAITPYPRGNAYYENPSILVSNNGQDWQVPLGLVNPLDDKPIAHHCDTEIKYNDSFNELWVYYMDGGSGTSYMKLMRSSNGIDWLGPEVLLKVPDYMVSPAVVKRGSNWQMWSVSTIGWGSNFSNVKRRTSMDGKNWSLPEKVKIDQPGKVIWHLDVRYLPAFEEYWMIFCAYDSKYASSDLSEKLPGEASEKELFMVQRMYLYFARSDDGINWRTFDQPILKTSFSNSWDNNILYRSTFRYDPKRHYICVWYSAADRNWVWHMGYTERNLNEFLKELGEPEEPPEEIKEKVACKNLPLRIKKTAKRITILTEIDFSQPLLLYDITGRLLKTIRQKSFSIAELGQGTYFLRYKSQTVKFVIIR